MIYVFFDDEHDDLPLAEAIKIAASTTLQLEDQQDTELTIRISNDEEIQQLNAQFLGNDKPTDVLSFPSDEFDPDEQSSYIGDIIISYDTAQSQALTSNHPIEAEIQLLTIHGVLHLLGYDHDTQEAKREMWTKQERILKILGTQINSITEK
ncbi:MAG TPA: rRNA maturation RNase YbeY [Bellilinea sp.]|nr:rRNA maturation RNase YbeY [Bellilinea sp.]